MAFSLGYVSLCDKNIQRLYTTTTPRKPPTRRKLPYGPDFLREFARLDKFRRSERRFMEYDPKHNIELPRAPAFHCKRSSEVKNIVTRLMMKPKDRFHFIHPTNKNAYNDWKTAHEEKLQRLRDTVNMFGGPKHSRPKSKQEAETDDTEIKPKENRKGRKKRKRSKLDDLADFSNVDKLPDITESEPKSGED